MYYQEYGDVIVPAHPKEDVNASGEDEEKKVVKEEKNRNRRRAVALETARSVRETGIHAGLRVLRVSYVVIYRCEGE